jgi:DNA-binding transcriptional ArsR family regulator
VLPKGLAAELVSRTEVCGQYRIKNESDLRFTNADASKKFTGNRTNRTRNIIGTFAALKSLTPSGFIQNYRAQSKFLEQNCKLDIRSIETHLALLKEMGLVEIIGAKHSRSKAIRLTSWAKVCKYFDVEFKNQFTTYSYDVSDKKITPRYIVEAIEESEKQQQVSQLIIDKISNNHLIKEFLAFHYGINTIDEKAVALVHKLREQWFIEGFPERSFTDANFAVCAQWLYSFNTCTYRTRNKVKTSRNLLQPRRVTYLRKQLATRGIATCKYRTLKSGKNRVCNRKLLANGYDTINRLSTWHTPAEIAIPGIVTKTQAA